MSDAGIKVSKVGYSVLTATPQELAFSSSYASDLIELSGRLSHNHTGTSSTVSVSHGLGVPKQFFVFDYSLGQLPYFYSDGTPADNAIVARPYITSTQLVIEVTTNVSESFSILFSYAIYTKPM